ncbi:capsid protein [Trichinella pseudospiralis]
MLVLPKIFTCNRHHDYNKITQGTLIVANWNSAVFVLPLEQRKQIKDKAKTRTTRSESWWALRRKRGKVNEEEKGENADDTKPMSECT